MRIRYLEILIILPGFLSLTAAILQPTFAYIDPGTGSYFIQMLVAGFAGFMMFFVKPISEKLKNLFKKDPKPKEENVKK